MPNDDPIPQLDDQDQDIDQTDDQKSLDQPSLLGRDELDDPIVLDNEPKQTQYGLVKARGIETEMKESYLDYAMSVIVARALPDVRDGLKPVHRRVLYSMHELGLTSRAKYRKSATVVGDVLGKYHPHGDTAVYDTMVRLAQHFSMRYPLVDGQGNFGSIDGDNAAAMRYTEAKMTVIAEEMLADIDKDTVDFAPNFDGSREEPTVLPSRVPQLLLNGTLGIAVGMATNIPPHNLGELCDGIMHLIDNPEAQVDELMQFIKAPDFPTGANIYNLDDIKQAYATGKGKVLMRAVANIEEKKSGNGYRIIVSEIPYQVNKSDLISKIAELVKLKKIEGISDLRDESDRKEGVRIVIELKSNAYPKKVLNLLYELTAMQSTFHINMLALVDGIQPRVLTLKNVLEEFIKHRQVVVRRRTEFELARAKDRAHILEGLKIALDHIDEIIALIKKSETKEVAHKNLMGNFKLSDKQASAILEMRLSALAGLERQKIEDELKEKLDLIKKLEAILASKTEILRIIKEELAQTRDKYADERRTKIVAESIGSFQAEDLIPNEQVVITLTKTNYIKRVPIATYRSQNRGGMGVTGMATKEEDVVEHLLVAKTHDDIMFFTDRGRLFVTKVYDLPSASRQAKGQAIVNILQISPEEKVTTIITLSKEQKQNAKYFFMGTKFGVVKKTLIEAYKNVRKTGLIAIKLNDKDELNWVATTTGENSIVMVARNGQSIYFNEQDVRPMGRSAAGVRGIKLRPNDEVITMDVIPSDNSDVFTILERGFGKRTQIKNFTKQKRGGIGIRASKTSEKVGKVVEALVVDGVDGECVIVSTHGQVIRMPLKSIKRLGRDTQGVTLMRLKPGDKVASMTVFNKDKDPVSNDKKPDDNQLQLVTSDEGMAEEQKNIETEEQKNIGTKKLENEKTDEPEKVESKNSKKKVQKISKKAKSPEATARISVINKAIPAKGGTPDSNLQLEHKEGDMGVDIPQNWSKTQKNYSSLAIPANQGKTINKIEPKKIVTKEKPFTPYVKAAKEKKVSEEFVPYIKAQKQSNTNVSEIINKIQTRHTPKININTYQNNTSSDQNSDDTANDNDDKKILDVNYWGNKKK